MFHKQTKHEEASDKPKRANLFLATKIIGLSGVIVLSVGITLWVTRPKPKYPLGYEANFIAACVNKGNSAYGCVCPLRYIEQHYTYKDALKIDASATANNKLPDDLQRAFDDCRK